MNENNKNGRQEKNRDFPEFIPPLLVKELRQGLGTRGFVLFLILFPVLMAFPFFFYMMLGKEGMSESVVSVFFWIGLVLVFLLFNPLRSLYSVDQEKKTRSDELIMLTRITSARIVQEKWISFTLQTILVVLVVLPFFLLRYFLGGVNLVQELVVMVWMFLASCILTAAGLWVSGMPMLYRVLFAFALSGIVCTAVPVTVDIFDSSGSSVIGRFLLMWETRTALFVSIVVMVMTGVYAACKGMLVLASRWFAAVSENTAFPLRKLLFGGAIIIWGAFMAGMFSTYENGKFTCQDDFPLFLCVTTLVLLAFCILELILPERYQFVHLKKLKQRGGLAARFMPLLLPGWQSAGAGFLILAAVFMGMGATVFYCEADMNTPFEVVARAFLMLIANILFFAIVFRPLYRKVGIHSLIVFPVIFAVFLLGIIVLKEVVGQNMKQLLSYLPLGCFYNFSDQKMTDIIAPGNYTFIGLSFLIFICASLPFWRKYCKDRLMAGEK